MRCPAARSASEHGGGVTPNRVGEQQNGTVASRHERTTDAHPELFTYDALNRLKRMEQRQPDNTIVAVDHSYDELGNLTAITGSETYTYDPTRRQLLTSVGANSFTYDDAGNQVTRSGPKVVGGTQTVDYSNFDLPKKITIGEGDAAKTLSFEYDASQTRVVKRSGSAKTFYADDHYQRAIPSNGDATEHRYRIFAGSRAIAEVVRGGPADGKTYSLHGDALGSITAINDGSTTSRREYAPFGSTTPEAPDTTNVRAGFTGHEHDTEAGLINMKGRIYDPTFARFLTADPVVDASWSQGLNRYAYVHNSPLNYVDSSGFTPEWTVADGLYTYADWAIRGPGSAAAAGATATGGAAAAGAAAGQSAAAAGQAASASAAAAAGTAAGQAAAAAARAAGGGAAGTMMVQTGAPTAGAIAQQVASAIVVAQNSVALLSAPAPNMPSIHLPTRSASASGMGSSATAYAQNQPGILAPPARRIPSSCDVGACVAQAGPGAVPLPAPTPVAPPMPSAAQSQEIGQLLYRLLEATNPIPLIQSGLQWVGDVLSLATPRDAQRLVNRGLGPGEITRIDEPSPRYPHTQWEAHSGGRGSPALKQDGTWKHLPPGKKSPFSRKTLDWLEQHGWKRPQ
jgi:RHS repeat-associated protein